MGGWENRSNSHGGYDAVRGVVIHHDAGGSSDTASVNFQCFVDADRPNAALHVGRKGEVWIMAAGATNTQGLGGPIAGVPLNQGNFQLIGIEMGNNGVGEPYPAPQQNTILWLCRTLVAVYGARFGFGPGSVISHFEWAPARKNDPSGPSRWSPGGGRWDMAAFRSDVAVPPPPPGDDFMTPEDKTYLDTKFKTLFDAYFVDIRGVAFGQQMVDTIKAGVRAELETSFGLDALRTALVAAIGEALADATVTVDAEAIAKATLDAMAARLAA